jgi:hypothetical protein
LEFLLDASCWGLSNIFPDSSFNTAYHYFLIVLISLLISKIIYSRDQFTSKYSGQKKYKWRTSEVRLKIFFNWGEYINLLINLSLIRNFSLQITAIDGLVIRIHFQGWSPKHGKKQGLCCKCNHIMN